jgi:integrase
MSYDDIKMVTLSVTVPEQSGNGIDGRIAQANGRLKSARAGVAIERRGDRLWLRGTFPPKPGSGRDKPYRQKVSLGVSASVAGVQHAEKQARLMGAQLQSNSFIWSDWVDFDSESRHSVSSWIERFEKDYWSRNDRNDQSETTWDSDYRKTFSKLPLNEPLTPELLLKVIESTEPDSRTRRRVVQVLQRLSKFAGVDVEIGHLVGSYSAKRVNPRSLPTDAAIVEARNLLKHQGWQWILGMIACYGLRPHEAFLVDLSEFPVVVVPDTNKTRTERFMYPLYPEWAEQWRLSDRKLPNLQLQGASNAKLGAKVSGEFYDRKIPFKPYDLRHCYARRCFEFSLPPDLAAGLMGHSVQIHVQTYRAWIDRQTYRRAYEKLINRGDRPLPPQSS